MKQRILCLSGSVMLVMTICLFTMVPAGATIWDYTDDFALVTPQVGNGPDNAWFCYRADPNDWDGLYTLFSSTTPSFGGCYDFPTNAFHIACSMTVVPGTFNFNNPTTNPEPDVVVAFRAPSASLYNVSGLFRDLDGTDSDGPTDKRGVKVEITTTVNPGVAGSDRNISAFSPALLDVSNTNEAMRALLGGQNPLPIQTSFDFDIFLEASQNLFFRVNDLGSNRFDLTNLSSRLLTMSFPNPPPFSCCLQVSSAFQALDTGDERGQHRTFPSRR